MKGGEPDVGDDIEQGNAEKEAGEPRQSGGKGEMLFRRKNGQVGVWGREVGIRNVSEFYGAEGAHDEIGEENAGRRDAEGDGLPMAEAGGKKR